MPALPAVVLVPVLASGLWLGARTGPAPVRHAPDAPPGAAVTPARTCVTDASLLAARRYLATRPGVVSFAVYEHGQLRSIRGGVPYRSASLVKAMLLVADLRRHVRVHAALSPADRGRLGAMIQVSDNGAATATFNLVGGPAVRSVAHLVGMRRYAVGGGWGTSQLTASDQARLWGRLDAALPATYRAYARRLLRSVVPAQTWGGAPVARAHGFKTLFKSGWLPRSDGWVVHQGLRIEQGTCHLGIAVLTGRQPSMAAGVASIRGVVARLLGERPT